MFLCGVYLKIRPLGPGALLCFYMPLDNSCATRHSSPLGLAGKAHVDWPDQKKKQVMTTRSFFSPKVQKNFLKFLSFATLCFDLGDLVPSLQSDPWITTGQPPPEIDT